MAARFRLQLFSFQAAQRKCSLDVDFKIKPSATTLASHKMFTLGQATHGQLLTQSSGCFTTENTQTSHYRAVCARDSCI